MDETPFFFSTGSYELFAIHHRPTGSPNGKGFVFCHPFMEEKLWAHRVYVSFARELASRGYSVLRFDHFGQGDSDGEFTALSLGTLVDDIEAATKQFRSLQPDLVSVGLLGLRLGGTVAALAAQKVGAVDQLVLWEPIVNGKRYMQEVLRANLTAQMAAHGRVLQDRKKLEELMREGETINIEGYELGAELFDEVSGIDLLTDPLAGIRDVLVAQTGREGQKSREELTALCSRFEADFERVTEDPFWREIKPFYQRAEQLTRATLGWLGEGSVNKDKVHG